MAPEASDMMRAPDAEMAPAQTLERAVKAYAHRDDRFSLDKKIYGQYFQLYYQRLMLLLPRLKLAVEAKWPGALTAKVLDLKEGEECVIMGTLYKDMKLKPSILDEYGKDLTLGATIDAKKFTADDDALVLEDEGARVKLVGAAADPRQFVTGVVMACRGKVVQDGEFEVSETCFPAPAPQRPFPVVEKDTTADAAAAASRPPPGEYVALVSGLRVGDARASDPTALELLLDYLTGNLGSSLDQRAAASVARVVIAGGALAEPEDHAGGGQAAGQIQDAANVRAQLRSLDVFLTQLACSVPVDVMPGEGDPTNQALPQQPLHPCLFPEAARFAPATFAAATNPHDFSVGSCDFLGTSGQNVDNMRAYMDVSSSASAGEEAVKTNLASGAESLDLMASSLRWQHVAPSAPDTLACYPYKDRDPFYVAQSPHVYFAGNQPAFGARLVRDGETRTLLVSVPDFARTGVIAMVNVDTLECFPARFDAA